ncbi:MAG: hypothetical protein ACOYKA_03905, partial [Legionellaceae bacterium]
TDDNITLIEDIGPQGEFLFDATPLMYAVIQENEVILKALLKHPRLDPSQLNPHKDSALTLALKKEKKKSFDILCSDSRIFHQLIQLILEQPTWFQRLFKTQTHVLIKLIKNRGKIWSLLQNPEALGLTEKEQLSLFDKIMSSSREHNESRRHPLHTILFKKINQTRFFEEETLDPDTIMGEMIACVVLKELKDEVIPK